MGKQGITGLAIIAGLILTLTYATIATAGIPFTGDNLIQNALDDPEGVKIADIDGDGDNDIVVAINIDNELHWYENTAGDGTAWTQHVIDNTMSGAMHVDVADADGDGDLDIAIANYGGGDIYVWLNTAGDGSAWASQLVSSAVVNPHSVVFADFDGDGDQDLASASFNDDTVAWYSNDDGDGTAWTQAVISTSADAAWSVTAGDIDGDNDMDIISASYNDNKVQIYTNNGSGTFSIGNNSIVASSSPRSVALADINADGNLDIIVTDRGLNQVSYLPGNGDGTLGARVLIGGGLTFPNYALPLDYDGDGDIDVVSTGSSSDNVGLFENTGGGSFAAANILTATADGIDFLDVGDLDGDGDLDVVGAERFDDEVRWYENVDQSAPVGVAVHDGVEADIDVQIGTNAVRANWDFSDDQTHIVMYEMALGSFMGGTDIVGFTGMGTDTEGVLHTPLTDGQTIYVTVRATNAEGLAGTTDSDGVLIDTSATPVTIFMSGSGNDTNSGMSENSAKASLQGAIDAANEGDHIAVRPGTYFSAGNYNVNLRGKELFIFSTDGPFLTQFVSPNFPGFRSLIIQSGEPSETTIRGLLFYGGQSSAVYVNNSNATFRGCIFDNNTTGTYGGGLLADNNSLVDMKSCYLLNNSAMAGGAIAAINGSTINTRASIFIYNSASANGGATYDDASGTITMNNNTIMNNTATSSGGGIYTLTGPNNSSLFNSIVWGNTASANNGLFVDSAIDIGYSILQDAGPLASATVLDTDPLVSDIANFDPTLQPNSPARNGADSNTASPRDAFGRQYTSVDGIPDMGALEYVDPQSGPQLTGSTAATDYSMWALPLAYRTQSPLAYLTSILGDVDNFNWRAYRWFNGAYEEFTDITDITSSNDFRLRTHAYWLLTRQDVTLSLQREVGHILGSEVLCPPGWTMVGNPYAHALQDFDNRFKVRTADSQYIPWASQPHLETTVYGYNSSLQDYEDLNTVPAFKGFWVNNTSSETAILYIISPLETR